MFFAVLSAQANPAVQVGTQTQQSLIAAVYRQDIPGKFRRTQPIPVRFLADDAMNASIRDNDSQESDDDRNSIDGIYQDNPPVILLRASRPADELTLVFTHEYGHFVWGSLLSENQRTVFRRIYAVDKDDHRLVTDYAEASPEEGFAETFSFFVLHAHRLAELEPRISAYFSALAFPAHQATPSSGTHRGMEWEEKDAPQ